MGADIHAENYQADDSEGQTDVKTEAKTEEKTETEEEDGSPKHGITPLGLAKNNDKVQYIARIILAVCILLGFVVSRFYPYPSGLLHWHWGNHKIAPVPVK